MLGHWILKIKNKIKFKNILSSNFHGLKWIILLSFFFYWNLSCQIPQTSNIQLCSLYSFFSQIPHMSYFWYWKLIVIEYIFNNWNATCGCYVKVAPGDCTLALASRFLPFTSSLLYPRHIASTALWSLPFSKYSFGRHVVQRKEESKHNEVLNLSQSSMSELMESREPVLRDTQMLPCLSVPYLMVKDLWKPWWFY